MWSINQQSQSTEKQKFWRETKYWAKTYLKGTEYMPCLPEALNFLHHQHHQILAASYHLTEH